MTDPIVGIDLGTSNSAVAHMDGAGNVHVLADESNFKIHPSVVSFHPNGGVIVGASAKQRKVIDPANTVFSVKRLIGRQYSSPEVQTAKLRMPYQIKEGGSKMPMIVTRAGEFAVPEISAIVLDHLKNIASVRLNKEIHRAVVTVPASFNDAQRSATATAGAVAGLTVVRVLNEPTAAALAYGHSRELSKVVAVYDFGGGTFDVSILKYENGVYEVLGTAGDSFLGGDDLDERLVEKMVGKFLAETRIDLKTNEVSMMRLRAVAEQTKIELSRRSRAVVRIDEIAYGPRGAALNLNIELTRDELIQEVSPIISRTFPVCDEALSLANLPLDAIEDVILVGGTTKIPYVREQVSRYFNRQPRTDIPAEEAVAQGAALQASVLERTLARTRRSSKISVVQPIPSEFDDGGTTTSSGSTGDSGLLDSLTLDEGPRRTNPYGAARPDGSYQVRAKTVERLGVMTEDDPNVTSPRTTQPQAVPFARITQRTPAPVGSRTAYGVPAAPRGIDLDLGPSGAAFDEIPTNAVGQDTQVGPALDLGPLGGSGRSVREGPGAGSANEPSTISLLPDGPIEIAPLANDPSTITFPPERPRITASASVPPPPRATQTHPVAPPPIPLRQTGRVSVPPPPVVGRVPTSDQSLDEIVLGLPSPSGTAPGLGAASAAPPAPPPASVSQTPTIHVMPAHQRQTMMVGPPPGVADPIGPAPGFMPPVGMQQLPINIRSAGPTVLDVTPRGLGIGTVAGFCEELIPRNARLPTEKMKLFVTSRDQQDMVRIVVCQGESRRLDNNVVIGDLKLENLPPRPRGETRIEVTFRLDASGILNVRARDEKTGKEQVARLDTVGNMTDSEVSASRERLTQLRRE